MISPLNLFRALVLALGLFACSHAGQQAPPAVHESHEHEYPNETDHLAKTDILELLFSGNQRFMEDHPLHPDQTLERIRELQSGQHPFAAVISCSDSRVPPELIFDQGLGDLFVIRNAGNIIGDYELGSVEYAAEHLNIPVVVVLGHTQCGAIGAFIEHKHDLVPNHVQAIIDYLKNEKEEQELDENSPDYYLKAVKANVLHGIHVLKTSEPLLKPLVDAGKLTVIGALYDLETGKVSIVEDAPIY